MSRKDVFLKRPYGNVLVYLGLGGCRVAIISSSRATISATAITSIPQAYNGVNVTGEDAGGTAGDVGDAGGTGPVVNMPTPQRLLLVALTALTLQ